VSINRRTSSERREVIIEVAVTELTYILFDVTGGLCLSVNDSEFIRQKSAYADKPRI